MDNNEYQIAGNNNENKQDTKYKHSILIFIGFGILTILLWQIPSGHYILYPFTILGTWFHEMGHGLTAFILGGNFHQLTINPDGSGIAEFSGDIFLGNFGRAIVAAMGPLGPTLAGALFILVSNNKKLARIFLFLFGIFLLLSVIIWVRTIIGVVIILLFAIAVIAIALLALGPVIRMTIQFFGMQAIASLYLSINYLFSSGAVINGNSYNSDTQVMAQYLWLPYWFWGGLLLLISLLIIIKSVLIGFKK